MANAQILNLGTSPSNNPEFPPVVDEFTPTTELIEKTQSDLQRMRARIDQQQNAWAAHERRTKVLSVLLGVLIVFLAAAAWTTFPLWKEHKTALIAMPVLQNLSNALGGRMSSVEANINKMNSSLPALTARMDQLQANARANLQTARNQAQIIANQVGQRIRDDVTQGLERVQSRLSGVESNQKEAGERVTQLQEQVAGMQRELAAMRDNASTASGKIKELSDAQQSSSRDVLAMNERIGANQSTLSTIGNAMARERVEFQTQTGRAAQIGPDIVLTVERTNVGKQLFDGMLQIGPDARRVTIREQGIQKPVTFYTSGESRPMELVITGIAKNVVSGYLIMPAKVKTATE
jgi:chromosome segregation ATPase